MLVFIDESGCPGFNPHRDSDPVFVLAMVVFANVADAVRAQDTIADLRKAIGHRSEFKFSKCRDGVRDAFFRAVSGCAFSVRAVVVTRRRIVALGRGEPDREYYRFFARELLKAGAELRGARIRIDGTGNPTFTRELRRYLSVEMRGRISKLRMADSRGDPLIQLADMCVGAIARAHRDRSRGSRWVAMLGPKVHEIREYK